MPANTKNHSYCIVWAREVGCGLTLAVRSNKIIDLTFTIKSTDYSQATMMSEMKFTKPYLIRCNQITEREGGSMNRQTSNSTKKQNPNLKKRRKPYLTQEQSDDQKTTQELNLL